MDHDYKDYTAEDLALDPSFQNYCLESNEKDIQFWEDWIARNRQRKREVDMAKDLYFLLSGHKSSAQFASDLAALRNAVSAHLAADAVTAPFVPGPRKIPLLRKMAFGGGAAACVLLVMLMLTVRHPHTSSAPARSFDYVRISRAGEHRSFVLPDGSTVRMNAGSTLILSRQFGSGTREITLAGEAFFDVVHDPQRPFIIHTAAMDVRVLGTSFNVKAYPGDRTTETSLLKGSVEVTMSNRPGDRVILHPNEKIVCDNLTGRLMGAQPAITKTREKYTIAPLTIDVRDSSPQELSWTEDKLTFNDNSLAEIAASLERWYNVKIRFEDETVSQYRYTANFKQETITQVLKALQMSSPFHYEMDGSGEIIISK